MAILVNTLSKIQTLRTSIVLLLLILLQIVLHIKYLHLPPLGAHEWRQTQTLSVARNFSEEGMNIFEPRVDSRRQYSGIAGMEFPIVNFMIASGYKLFGYSYSLQRVVLLLFSLCAIVGCYFFALQIFKQKSLAFCASFFLIFSPMFCYYSITALPDVPSLGFMFLALWMWFEYLESESQKYFVLALAFLLVGGLIKIYALIIAPVGLVEILRRQRERRSRVVSIAGLALVMLLVSIWYLYARSLSATHHNSDFQLGTALPVQFSIVPIVLKKILFYWLPNIYINIAQFALLIVGLYVLVKRPSHSTKLWMLSYILALIGYVFTQFQKFDIHDYYMMPALPLLIIIAVFGLQKLFEESERYKWIRLATLALLFILPIIGAARAFVRFERIPETGDLLTIEQHLDQAIPDRSNLVVAASDNSPSVYLYFMHRKGWSATEEVSGEDFKEMVRNGARYLISDSRDLEARVDLRPLLTLISTHGKFNVFRLRSKSL